MNTKNSQTAWERWELASFDESGSSAPPKAKPVSPPPPATPQPKLPTAEEIERIHQEAFQAGHKEGMEAGRAEGMAIGRQAGQQAGEAAGRQAAAQLLTVAAKLDQALAGLDEAVGEELAGLALEIAREVLRQTIAITPETIVAVVREALGHLPHQHANIYLHPEDASLVRTYAGEQLSHAGHRIHEDPKLQRGDVVLEAAGAHVDGTLATRWRRVIETLGHDVPWVEKQP
ncbi:hypothetical protein B9N43_08895 [Denitratisoma sp. DHT3]|uniref:flagellar assembly protein FliH n=1 Tax=Denitratisoma sp. DHT3 TaxID=1981880 RepID=UPI00119832A3|nr:flagellar assembly protein FliH [Denitratisoma sp. DHT3]QDX81348.1 hypothetical protein B9N43_08895 [Denitratisoma sp. DHT3]